MNKATGVLLAALCGLLAGCAGGGTAANVAAHGSAITGRAMGGQLPVAYGSVQLWAAGSTGYGSAATLLTSMPSNSIATNAYGEFTITDAFSCPATVDTPVYLTITQGYSIPGQQNLNLALMAALGPCNGLSSIPFVNVNELTTVAAVWALAPFTAGFDHVGTTATNTVGLQNAFATANMLADIASGNAGGANLPAGTTVPTDEIAALGDILATCVNSAGGADGDGSPCGTLFHDTAVNGIAPTDTIGAALNMALHPAVNVAALYQLIPSIGAAFPTSYTQPAAWTLMVNYAVAGLKQPAGIANDASGNVWIASAGNNSVVMLDPVGERQFIAMGAAGSTPSALAIDANGDAWVTNSGDATIMPVSSAGMIGATVSGNGLSGPQGIAIDAAGYIWVANSGGAVSVFSSSGDAAGNYTDGSAPAGIAINPQ